jgi:hypothetical protein
MTKIVRPILPLAPVEYEERYFNQLVRTLEELISKTELPTRNIPDIADVSELSSLEVGDLYKDASGFVKIKT